MQYFQKLIGKDSGGLGYNLGETVASHNPAQIWTIQRGTKKDTGEEALVFVYDPKNDISGSKRKMALSGIQRLKTFRHPDILKFLASDEGSDGTLHVATEVATPLAEVMRQGKIDVAAVQWGLVCISRALGFLHSGQLIHGSLSPAAVFITPSGDWKLGGFEGTQPHDQAANLSNFQELQPEAYKAPEAVRQMWSALAGGPVHGLDSWALGCLIYAVHAGSLNSPAELKNIDAIPKDLRPFYQRLLASDPGQRARCSDLPEADYFKRSRFVEFNLFLDNMAIKDAFEKEAFLKRLPGLMEKLPRDFCVNKVLPVLCSSFDMGVGGSAAFSSIVQLKSRMSDEEFKNKVVVPHASKWYSNQQLPLQIKMELLQQVGIFAKLFDTKDMNEKVFPALCAGLADPGSPALRDLTVKTCVHIAPLLSERNLNNILMAKFAALQVDPEPAIRTNTTVCIGKLANLMTVPTRQKVLIPAFARALKDPFPPARSAGLVSLLSTQEYYGPVEIATKLYPCVGPILVDSELEVRTNGFKLLKAWQPRLDEYHSQLTKKAKENEAKAEANGQGKQGDAAASSWGIGSFTSITSALMGSETKPTTTLPTGSAAVAPAAAATAAAAAEAKPVPITDFGDDFGNPPELSTDTGVPATTASTAMFGAGANDDDDDEGWGDEEGWGNDDLDKMLDQANAKSSAQSLGLAPKAATNDWNSAPAKPADPYDMSSLNMGMGMGMGNMSSSVSARKSSKKAADDDWESLLGGSTSSTKKKPAKLGAVRR